MTGAKLLTIIARAAAENDDQRLANDLIALIEEHGEDVDAALFTAEGEIEVRERAVPSVPR